MITLKEIDELGVTIKLDAESARMLALACEIAAENALEGGSQDAQYDHEKEQSREVKDQLVQLFCLFATTFNAAATASYAIGMNRGDYAEIRFSAFKGREDAKIAPTELRIQYAQGKKRDAA